MTFVVITSLVWLVIALLLPRLAIVWAVLVLVSVVFGVWWLGAVTWIDGYNVVFAVTLWLVAHRTFARREGGYRSSVAELVWEGPLRFLSRLPRQPEHETLS